MKKSTRERQIAAKLNKERSGKNPPSLRLNAKTAKKLRKQAEFVPTEAREYVQAVIKNKHGKKRLNIKNKAGSPREVYQWLKKNPEGRVA